MKQSEKPEQDRRIFLKQSVGSIMAVALFGGMTVEEVLAAAQNAGKPVLTDRAFTDRIPSPQRNKPFLRELAEIKNDLPLYVNRHFYLVPGQLENFKKIPRADIAALNAALDKAGKEKAKVTVQTKLIAAECADAAGFRLKMSFDAAGLTVLAYRE
jgi:hypothetical protein